MAKRLTERQKKEIINLFTSGITIDELSNKFFCTKLTISRNLKKSLGENQYKHLLNKYSFNKKLNNNKIKNNQLIKSASKSDIIINTNSHQEDLDNRIEEEFSNAPEFIEIAPLNCDIENSQGKDLSSIPISDIDFPKTAFMIVDKKVELEIKHLEDYPKWQFLSPNELKRKTIEVFFDLKSAKSFCGKEQKVIKVPNTDVFRIVAPILRSRGISRIVSSDKLIAI